MGVGAKVHATTRYGRCCSTVFPERIAADGLEFLLCGDDDHDPRFVDALFMLRGAGHDVAVVECLYEPPPAAPPNEEVSATAIRFFEAERALVRDRLAEQGIAVGQWRQDDHLDLVLADVTARRRRTMRPLR